MPSMDGTWMRTVRSNRIGMSRTLSITWCGKSTPTGYPIQPSQEHSTDKASKARKVEIGMAQACQERFRTNSTRRGSNSRLHRIGATGFGIGHNQFTVMPYCNNFRGRISSRWFKSSSLSSIRSNSLSEYVFCFTAFLRAYFSSDSMPQNSM